MYKKSCKNCSNLIQAFMVEGAEFSSNDIPFCPTTAKEIPQNLISYSKAITIYNDLMKNGNRHFFIEDYVHFYIHDYKFDGNKKGIWFDPYNALKILQHFAGIITPDFSTYADYPFPIKIFNTYRMRAFGYWYGQKHGGSVINNVRWGTEETFSYCFDGIEKNSIVAIGSVASKLRDPENQQLFEVGFFKMLEVLEPQKIIFYGTANCPGVDKARKQQIEIIHFRSERDLAFRGKRNV